MHGARVQQVWPQNSVWRKLEQQVFSERCLCLQQNLSTEIVQKQSLVWAVA